MGKLTNQERFQIFTLSSQSKYNVTKIAKILNRSKSSISEEIRRNGMNIKTYDPDIAQQHADLKKQASVKKIKVTGELKEAIDFLLTEKRFSPEQISAYLKNKYPSISNLHTCHETIYRYLYRSKEINFFSKYLRRRRKKRKKRGQAIKYERIKGMISISKRPSEVSSRQEVGHWEADYVIGKDHKTAIGVCVERATRKTIIIHLGEKKDSKTFVRALSESLKQFPKEFRKSLTYDQGSEMTSHKLLTQLCGIPVYFAHKACPWERGTNENTNGLIRDFFPKRTDFSKVSKKEILKAQELLDERPRKVLGYSSPKDALGWFLKNPNKQLKDFLEIKL